MNTVNLVRLISIGAVFASTLISQPAFSTGNEKAGAGGHGAGSAAFAIQSVASANPNLTPKEVLLKMFADAETRTITVEDLGFKYGSSAYQNTARMETSLDKDENLVNASIRFFFENNNGPAFPNLVNTYFVDNNRSAEERKRVALRDRPSGTTVFVDKIEVAELRAYSSTMIVGVAYAYRRSTDESPVCNILSSAYYVLDHEKAGDICNVFYFWQ
jgi:hypothetical protein